MDFAALPPEINSSRLYSGPGTSPLLTAATAWEQLFGELSSAATSCQTVIANLTDAGWRGPASMTMVDALRPYIGWLRETATQAEQTAAQAKAAASAYQAARAAVVPPSLIATNRARLHALVAGNFFGQNSPAIAATEAEYDRMWVQDVAAMYGYSGSAATASRLAPFRQAPQTTQPGGTAAQAAAVAQAGAAGAGHAGALSGLSAVASPASGAAASSSGMVPVIAGEPLTAYGFEAFSFGGMGLSVNDEIWRLVALGTRMAGWYGSALRDFAQGIGPYSPVFGIPFGPTASTVSAVMDRASVVGGLTVPPTWATAVEPAADTAAVALTDAEAAEDMFDLPGSMLFGETLMGNLAGRAISAAAAKARSDKGKKVVPRSPAGG